MDSIRYSHPKADRLGKRFVGGDEGEALKGGKYISQAKGTLGVSQRAFVPIIDENNKQIGVVSVGLLLTELEEQKVKIRHILYLSALLSIFIGLMGGILLSKNIKKNIFGLEPHQIAALLEERNVIISSIKEGIIAIDRENRVILINDKAKKILSLENYFPECLISDIIPNTKLPLVVQTGKEILDEEQMINNIMVLVNRNPLISGSKVIGAVATFRDMSEIRNLVKELTETKSYIDVLRAQQHEYLNKLNVISGLLQLKKFTEATNFIVNTVAQKQKMSDFLRKNIKTPSVSGLIIAKTNKAQEHSIELVVNPESRFPKIGDDLATRVVTIVGNVLENAIESLQNSDKKGRKITLHFIENESSLEIRIKDNGDGLPEELKGKVFDYGYTTKESLKERGIGLFLVKEQIEQLNGKLDLILEGGVEFVITIPKKNLIC